MSLLMTFSKYITLCEVQKSLYTSLFYLQASAVELARHVLAEVPQQVTNYYSMRGMTPIQPPAQQTPPS